MKASASPRWLSTAAQGNVRGLVESMTPGGRELAACNICALCHDRHLLPWWGGAAPCHGSAMAFSNIVAPHQPQALKPYLWCAAAPCQSTAGPARFRARRCGAEEGWAWEAVRVTGSAPCGLHSVPTAPTVSSRAEQIKGGHTARPVNRRRQCSHRLVTGHLPLTLAPGLPPQSLAACRTAAPPAAHPSPPHAQ